MSGSTRSAAVAGLFYPSNPNELRGQIAAMLREVPRDDASLARAYVVPHAGYVYSGPVAARVYARLAAHTGRVRRVVLMGPCHRVALRGMGLSSATHFETPLGRIELDREGAEELLSFPEVVVSDAAHAQEHSLEVQIPFIQEVLGDVLLLPIACGLASTEAVAKVMDWALEDESTLVLLSSDLSHFHSYDEARRLDAATAQTIEALDDASLESEGACGAYPLRGLLRAAKGRGLRVRRLDLRNSGDTAGAMDQVVGYGAWALE